MASSSFGLVELHSRWQAGSLLIGLFLIWVAVASPVATWDHELLTVHMIQHLLLMTVAAPLILLGQPVMAFLLALPPRFARVVVCPLLRWRPVQQLGSWLAQPLVCWLAATAALVGWHIPAALTLGLRSEAWHVIELGSFLGTGLLFWWPVVQPWPSVSRPHRPTVLYLLLATLPCDILSGFLVFSERIHTLHTFRVATHGPFRSWRPAARGALMWTWSRLSTSSSGLFCSAAALAARAPEAGGDQLTRVFRRIAKWGVVS